MGNLILGGVLCALAIYCMLWFLDIQKIAGYHLYFDFGTFLFLILLFQGTFSGMMTGFIAGLTLTALFVATKKVFGYKTRSLHGWVYHEPEWAKDE